jgi:peptidoglycan/xylan/chitin deacetylase (PgdA/CDA1 family)
MSDIGQDAANYFISHELFLRILDEVVERPDIDLTFDDGYASNTEIVLPALRERGLTARFFPLAGCLGRPGYLDADGVRTLAAAGMSIGSHGMRHRSWRGLDGAATYEELSAARALLAEAAGAPVTTAACPFGQYDRRLLSSLRRLGYRQVFTSDSTRARPGSWLQPRYSLLSSDTLGSVRSGILTPPPLAARVRGAAVKRLKAWR